jgi:hypothetical protein
MASMVEPLLSGFIVGIGVVLMAGLRRLAWRYAVVEAVGVGLVFALLRGWPGMSADVAVLLAAIGGALASLAFERGERDRERRVAEILRGSSIPG